MILRLWHGHCESADADAYERLLLDTIAPGIMGRQVPGLHSLDVLRRLADETDDGSVETLTAMRFDDMAAVSRFVGGDPSGSVVPPEARALLARHDERSAHYRLLREFRS